MKDKNFKSMGLSDEILKALNNLGFENPSEVQKEAIPYMLRKEDIIVKSQTGSGKTASFGIPLCEMMKVEESKVQGLILVPTRELALQVKEDISNIGRIKKIRCAAVFGKQPFNEQVRELKQRVHIVAGTPGRISDHINRGNLKLEDIKFVVVDEADKMLNMGFIDQIGEILEKIPKERNTALFSATLPEQIEILCSKYMKNPKIITVEAKALNRDKIKQSYLEVEEKDKLSELCRNLYANAPEAAIIFCNTRDKVKNVFNNLKREGIKVEQLHGDMEQKDRLQTMERFKNKEFKVLVATDIAARGIHIDHITHVFNYEIPMEKESYVHRIGRTGRAGKEGFAISLVSSHDKKYFHEVEEYIGYKIEKGIIPEYSDVVSGRNIFRESQKEMSKNIGTKKKNIHSDITKVHITAGKKKKIRPIDIVGCFSNLEGITGDDVGIIDVQDGFSYVDILNGKGKALLKKFKEVTIKGKKVKITEAKKS
ncbi:DEAD/DEAH box helicase [Clostridium carnis]